MTTGVHFETLHIRKDGTMFPVEVKANAGYFAGERLIMAIVRDITERKMADEALRKSEGPFFPLHAASAGAWRGSRTATGVISMLMTPPRKHLTGPGNRSMEKRTLTVFPPDIAKQFAQERRPRFY
jgi:PAS domain-containing protein